MIQCVITAGNIPVGMSASQCTKEVTDTGAVVVANDGVGPVTRLILPSAGTR